MPFGIISDEEFDAMLHKGNNPIPIIKERRSSAPGVPEIIRNIAAESAINGQDQQSVAEVFGISKSSVNAYSNGATSPATYNDKNEKLTNHVNRVKARITNRAQNTLFSALKEITKEKLQKESDVKVLSGVAKDMAAVIRDMEPDTHKGNTNNGVQIVIHAPTERKIDSYEVVEAKE